MSLNVLSKLFFSRVNFYCWPVTCIVLCLFIEIFGSKGGDQCPESCSCLGSYVDCSQDNFFDVPSDIPAWVVQLDLSANKLRENCTSDLLNLYNLTELKLNKNMFQTIPPTGSLKELRLLNLGHNGIKELKSESMGQLEELNLNYNQIEELLPESFPNNNSIKILHLINNKIRVIHKGAFANLNNLIDLKLNKNRITQLPKHLFGSQKFLKTLELNKNQLKTIEGLVFQGLDRLATLRLRHNNISLFSDGAFFGLKSINLLQLDYNSVSTISKSWMYGLNSLVTMSISNNLINKIEPDSWELSYQLEELDLSNNKIQSIDGRTFEHLTNLLKLKLDFNKISSITEDAFSHTPKLELLQLSHNEISWTVEDMNGPFSKLHNLQRFNLASNHITSIISKALVGLNNLISLDLSNNNLTTIQEHSFDSMKLLQDLKINSSSFLCDCNLYWLSVWVQKMPPAKRIHAQASCAYPTWLRGKMLVELGRENFTCSDSPKPLIIENPKSQLAIRGAIAQLNCKAVSTSNAKMTFLWKRNNRNVSNPNIREYVSAPDVDHTAANSQLLLPNVTHADSGNYQCIVSNNLGTTYSSKARLTIVTLPKFGKVPLNVTVKAGETAKLECSANGEPTPQIAWQKDGGNDFPAARERRMHVMTLDDAFFIIDAKLSDMGIYSCTAQNPAGIIVSNATLNILEPPSFVNAMENKEVTVGGSVVIGCMMSGSPKPILRWLKGGIPIITTERHFFTAEDQLLVIVNAVESDAGLYECEITNSLGSRKDSTELKVIQPLNTLPGFGGYGSQAGGYPGQQNFAGQPGQPNFTGQPGGYQQPPAGGYPGQTIYQGQPGGYQGQSVQNRGPYPANSQSGISSEIQQWFSAVDKDRSGHISAQELKGALVNAQGKNFSDVACQLMIGMFDKDKSGTINVEEFDSLYSYVNKWLSVFKTYDRDQSGHIEESELTQAFSQMGFRFSPEFIQFLVKKSDVEEHKRVSVDQFIVMCVQVQRFTEAFRQRDTQQQGVITIGFEEFLSVALSCSI